MTLIDSLDMLAVVGNYTEFRRVAKMILDSANFDIDINASVFETNIRGRHFKKNDLLYILAYHTTFLDPNFSLILGCGITREIQNLSV